VGPWAPHLQCRRLRERLRSRGRPFFGAGATAVGASLMALATAQADGALLSAGGGNDSDASPPPPCLGDTPHAPPCPPAPPFPVPDSWSRHRGAWWVGRPGMFAAPIRRNARHRG
jgi:hypothetical protein